MNLSITVITTLVLFLFVGPTSATELPRTQEESRLNFFDVFTAIPRTSVRAFDKAFSKEAIPAWSLILGSTAILYYYDEKIYSWAQDRGRAWNLDSQDNTKGVLKVGAYDIVRLPTDTGSGLYFLGDGWTHAVIAGGFLGAGYIADQTYEVNTGYMILHGMMTSTIYNQILKRSFGRESPYVKTSERGAWRPFPSISNYQNNTSRYDAMPTGHVMTATMTFTILHERYPAYATPIKIVGGVWCTALAFQMVNNGVHWASDYPLGIGMGWLFGKMAVQMGTPIKKKNDSLQTNQKPEWMMFPSIAYGTPTVNFMREW